MFEPYQPLGVRTWIHNGVRSTTATHLEQLGLDFYRVGPQNCIFCLHCHRNSIFTLILLLRGVNSGTLGA